jgi:hypothetical protein
MKTSFLKQGIALAAAVVCIGVTKAQNIQHSSSGNNTYLNVEDDSTVSPVQTIITYRTGHTQYDMKMAQDKVIELYVNHRKIGADSFNVYSAIITKIKEQIRLDRLQAIEDMKQAKRDQEQAEKDEEQAREDQKQAVRDQQQAEEDRKQAEEDRKQGVKDQQQAEEDQKQAVRDQQQAEEDRKQAVRDQQQAEEDRKQAEEDQKQAIIDQKQAEEDAKIIKAFMGDIVKEGLAPNEKSIQRVMLNDDEFRLNGKLLSEDLHNKFKAKFLKTPGYSIMIGNNVNGYGIFINNDNGKDKQ